MLLKNEITNLFSMPVKNLFASVENHLDPVNLKCQNQMVEYGHKDGGNAKLMTGGTSSVIDVRITPKNKMASINSRIPNTLAIFFCTYFRQSDSH